MRHCRERKEVNSKEGEQMEGQIEGERERETEIIGSVMNGWLGGTIDENVELFLLLPQRSSQICFCQDQGGMFHV